MLIVVPVLWLKKECQSYIRGNSLRDVLIFNLMINETLLLHYNGDESITAPFPHDNIRSNHFLSCLPVSVLFENSTLTDLPGNIYKNIFAHNCCLLEHQAVMQPWSWFKNIKKIVNREHIRPAISVLSPSFRLYELTYNSDGFIHSIRTYLDLVVVCGLYIDFWSYIS